MEALYSMAAVFFFMGILCLCHALWVGNPKHLDTAVGKLEYSKRIMV